MNTPTEMPTGEMSPSPTESPTTEADPTTALRQALTKSAQASSSSGKFTFSSGENTANGTYDYQAKPKVALNAKVSDLTMDGKSKDAKPELIVADNVGYINPDGLFEGPGENIPWWKVNIADLKGPHGQFVAKMFDTATSNDPATIQKLADAYEDVKMVGTAEVSGKTVTHYTATYNVDAARSAFGVETTAPSPGGSPGASPMAGVHQLRSDVWVDEQGMVRKTRYRSEEGQKPQFTLTTTITDYNKPVTVKAPPADQTKQVTPQMLKQLGMGG
ncbi:hypothetical protein [Acrocarpospora phusangensis]|nr:hypothetical protein [Acrocarpospora phusangensis]